MYVTLSFSSEGKETTPERVGIDDDGDVGVGGIISSEEETGADPLLQENRRLESVIFAKRAKLQ